MPVMRVFFAIAPLLVGAAACGGTQPPPYRFNGSVMPGNATVVVDGLDNNFALMYEYASYADAVADLHVSVVVTYQGMTVSSEITPGWCVDQAAQMHVDLGEPTLEDLNYGITALAPYVESAHCSGTKLDFHVTP